MDFYTALKQVESRQKIHRDSWDDKNIYVDLQEGVLCIHNDSSSAQVWEISISDMTADDWVLYEYFTPSLSLEEGEIINEN